MKNWTIKDQYQFVNRIILFAVAPFIMIAVFVGVIVLGLYLFDHPSETTHFDAAQIMYREFGNDYRDDYLAAGQTLATKLLDSNVDEATKQKITIRLEQVRGEIRRDDLNPAEQDVWLRIDTAIKLRHLQERQVADIASKRCGHFISIAYADSQNGEITSSSVKTVCQ